MDATRPVVETGKEKKTRRRLRLSCVECTKRRQKCDRTYPCSLCVSRGVSHLCRWETVPVARPAPARPPKTTSSEETIQQLLSRIASLEQALGEQNVQELYGQTNADALFHNTPSGSSTLMATEGASSYVSPGPDIPSPSPSNLRGTDEEEPLSRPLNHLQPAAYATTSALAHLSLGHHGEYIGRGSVICALHAISTGTNPRFLYAKSTDVSTSARGSNSGLMSTPLFDRVEDLLRNVPPLPIATILLQAFFTESNWRFGIPEEWFWAACTQMWDVLEYSGPRVIQINTNWLSLLFAVLAYAPKSASSSDEDSDNSSDHYYLCAMTARRIAEDDYLNKPNLELSVMASAADGAVLSCLAVPLLCSYLSQTGRVSEAWKLAGTGLRNAEAVGMHRDPEWNQWQAMSKDEKILRRRAWWGLYIRDKMYSYILGRPQMIRKEIFDTTVSSPNEVDGSRNMFESGQTTFIRLCTLVGEALEMCFSVAHPDLRLFLEMDDRFESWENDLLPEHRLPHDERATSHFTVKDLVIIHYQRYTLHTWYLLCRTKLHIAALTGNRTTKQPMADVLESRKTCILMSMRLIELQCETHDFALQSRAEYDSGTPAFPGSIWFFEGCFSLVEATVALITTVTRFPWREKVAEADQLVHRAVGVLRYVAGQETEKRGEIARMGVEILSSLQQEPWWRAQVSDAATPSIPMTDSTAFQSGLSISHPAMQPVYFDYDWFSLYGDSPNLYMAIGSDGQAAPPSDDATHGVTMGNKP
ncbi:hypothetical protein DXG03_004055 [Asterophora parasitica]|uniref:Zn(2)-C6 fungal-type domain-containing protein n=1 Tax=Asterophora parasitica TaxID=117018 RepID=A0A9P7KD56_9AGAR|nr:hypothetical protein DXG03_004055 [Asterophora parasitica]